MLFNSLEFIFIFFPAVLLAYYGSARLFRDASGNIAPHLVLLAASTVFYAWWDYHYLWLLWASIAGNALWGRLIHDRSGPGKNGRPILAAALLFNLGLLGYYKYTNFFIENVNALSGADFHLQQIILPLGISFFTFTQIAFLVDIHRGEIREYSLLQYANIITFFPHLVAGPILFHHSMLPQLKEKVCFDIRNLSAGLTIFCLGLGKKVLLADVLGYHADQIFQGVQHGFSPGVAEAWRGAVCYTLQLYFDFSGYSDMAMGLALCLGIRIPLNFYSPYKALNIPDFWRRWHISLGLFLRDYLYIPLGGNRKGFNRKLVNLMIIMVVCGFWHGAGWTFIIWGTLHGLFMVANQIWVNWRARTGHGDFGRIGRITARLVTFLCVLVGWVLFRSDSLGSALVMLRSMIAAAPDTLRGVSGGNVELFMALGLLLAWFTPSMQQIFTAARPSDTRFNEAVPSVYRPLLWNPESPSRAWAVAAAVILTASLSKIIGTESAVFLYFQF